MDEITYLHILYLHIMYGAEFTKTVVNEAQLKIFSELYYGNSLMENVCISDYVSYRLASRLPA